MLRKGLFLTGFVVAGAIVLAALAPAGDAPRPRTARDLQLRPLMPPDAEVVRDPVHAYRVSLPRGWEQVRTDLTPRLAPVGGTILAVATFRPRGRACGPAPDLPDTDLHPRDALLLVQEELDAQPGNLPRSPRRLTLRRGVRWPCLDRPGIVGVHTWFRAHGRMLYVTAVAGERTSTRRRRELLGVLDALRFGPTPEVEVGVRPWTGGGYMRVGLSLFATHRSGSTGRRVRWYRAFVRGPSGAGCVSENDTRFSTGPPGRRLRAVLDPQRTKGMPWCRGHFRGVVVYTDGRYRRRAGRFSFDVR
jgi:hypothetical protein